jgi:fatty acid desaturase
MLHTSQNRGLIDSFAKAVVISPSDRRKIAHINAEVRRASAELRKRFPWLRQQSALGVAAFALAIGGMVASGWLYVAGTIPAWLCIIVTAFFASIVHEIEHDLIHCMYFPRHGGIRGLMMAVGWLARPGTINPFVRKKLHLRHHKVSGNPDDLEERAITNGEPYGIKRILMMADGVLAVVLRLDQAKGRPGKLLAFSALSYFPLGWLHHALFYAFLVLHAFRIAGFEAPLSASALAAVDIACVTWILPNVLRSFCLNFVSSSLHYYGDVERGNVLQQTQVLNAWFLAPLQLFCFNFGSTHAIHHFVATEPFYVRQLTARAGHRALRASGVRFNDLGTFLRDNRYAKSAVEQRAVSFVSARDWPIAEIRGETGASGPGGL